MKHSLAPLLLFLAASLGVAQESVRLYPGVAPGSEEWTHSEKRYHSQIWNTEVVTNVVEPTLLVFLPEAGKATGTGAVIAPGGGFYALSINSEGIDVARWLNERGVAAFVLKYRLIPSGEEAVSEMMQADRSTMPAKFAQARPLAVADGQAAMRLVRKRAAEWGVHGDRIVLMGFSAGGAVALGVAEADEETSRPNYLAPIYAGGSPGAAVPAGAPPLFVVAASNDQLGLAPFSVELYSAWLAAGKPAELHMYASGGHGFGMRKQGLPSDHWIDRFGDWLQAQGLLEQP
jgi:acetyl esterase/lipase